MASFVEVVAELRASLQVRNLDLKPTDVSIAFASPMFDTPIIAIPDVHLGVGDNGDIFLQGNVTRAHKLEAVLEATGNYLSRHPLSSYALQLGDWFDIWRVCGSDPRDMTYETIENADVYQKILDLDARLGLPHVIGNHDAGFLRTLPDRRTAQPELFRLGFWIGHNVYALHGHQTDLSPPIGLSFDSLAVHFATLIASIAPGFTNFEKYIDRQQGAGVSSWLRDSVLGIREDPPPSPRPPDVGKPPANVRTGQFVVREDVDTLACIVDKVSALPESHGRRADVLIVGHSHQPCVSWTEITGRPIFVVDSGCWVYGQANLLVAAGDTIAVFDVI
jgi:UDP-2,3-diacylglucosamine pyrophosphatase LpxH